MQNSNYNHINIEKDIYEYWEKNEFFKPKKNKKKQMKQMTLKEFMSISKNKPKKNTDDNELEDKEAFNKWTPDPNDKSRAATMREMFNLNCHVKEYTQMAIKKMVKNG